MITAVASVITSFCMLIAERFQFYILQWIIVGVLCLLIFMTALQQKREKNQKRK